MKPNVGPPVDLSPSAARRVLRPGRLIRRTVRRTKFGDGELVEHRVEIMFRGTWRLLGRTDLKDDVATGCCEWLEDPVGSYRERVVYGARLRAGMFHVVDRFSDG